MPDERPNSKRGTSEATLNRQEEQLANMALDFAKSGESAQALALVRKASRFWSQNLIALITICKNEVNPDILRDAIAYAPQYLQLADEPRKFESAYRFVLRTASNPAVDEIRGRVEARIDALDQSWRGENFLMPGKRERKATPEEISDPGRCLAIMQYVRRAERLPYIKRYEELHADVENVRYLKFKIEGILFGIEPPGEFRAMLGRLAGSMSFDDFRIWLRRVSGRGRDIASVNILVLPDLIARYVEVRPSVLEADDWIYLGRMAIKASERIPMRICFEYFARHPEKGSALRGMYHALSKQFAGAELSGDEKACVALVETRIHSGLSLNQAASEALALWSAHFLR